MIIYIYNEVIVHNVYETVATDVLFISNANITVTFEILTIWYLFF
jgi:hypothetical protein